MTHAWTKKKPKKKRPLKNEKRKANRASDTEEQRKERLRIRPEQKGELRGHVQTIFGKINVIMTLRGVWMG